MIGSASINATEPRGLIGGLIQGLSQQSMTELTLTAIFEEAEEGGFIGYVATRKKDLHRLTHFALVNLRIGF